MSEKKFQFFLLAEEADKQTKTTVVNLKRIRVFGGDIWFRIPIEYQRVTTHHNALTAIGPVKSAMNVITKRGQYRTINATIPKAVADLYLDKDDNLVFKGIMLEEVEVGSEFHPPDPKLAELADCFQKFKPSESVKDIMKHFLIEKFSPKNKNVEAWCDIFEKESSRFLLSGAKQIEVFKSCLDVSMNDWFAVSQRKLSISADWTEWKELLLTTFSDSSWKPIRYAFNYRYLSGSLIDYAIKKERILLELDRNLPSLVILDLIVVGLPHHIQNSLNRNNVTSISLLHNKLKKFESEDKDFSSKPKYNSSKIFSTNKNGNDGSNVKNFEKKKSNVIKKPCSICAGKGFENRFHPESNCWNKVTKKSINNTETEYQSSGEESKN